MQSFRRKKGDNLGPSALTNKALDDEEEHDDFEKIVKELQFEQRAQPTDRLPTEEEALKKEAARLSKLEVSFIFLFIRYRKNVFVEWKETMSPKSKNPPEKKRKRTRVQIL
jgi:hypothetical protein